MKQETVLKISVQGSVYPKLPRIHGKISNFTFLSSNPYLSSKEVFFEAKGKKSGEEKVRREADLLFYL